MKQYRQSIQQDMVMTSKEVYSICQKIFCCKCLHCFQNQIVLTTDIRKQTLQKMIKNFVISDDEETIQDSIKLMILIYLCVDQNIPQKFIKRCQINPMNSADSYRTDLQFYIPQLCNYIVYHNDLKVNYLTQSIQKASKLSFYFAHLYYFYINSLQKIINNEQIQIFKKVSQHKNKFLEDMCKLYQGQMLNSVQFFLQQNIKTFARKSDVGYLIQMYGTKQNYNQSDIIIMPTDITLPNYSSLFRGFQEPEMYSFKSTINFFADLFQLSDELKNYQNKKQKIKQFLKQINTKLPACVYIPFAKDYNHYYNILNIVVDQTRLFATKMRTPFYICLQVYNPIQSLSQQAKEQYFNKIQLPITFNQNMQAQHPIPRKLSDDVQYIMKKHNINHHQPKEMIMKDNLNHHKINQIQTQVFQTKNNRYLKEKLLQYTNEMQTQPRLNDRKGKYDTEMKSIHNKQLQKKFNDMFGQTQKEMSERIKQKSIYKQFTTWKLIHLMIKTGDNLKQEQFALQLIYQFDYIFKLENLPLNLTPYEILSMGPDYGIIQMVKDSITFDKLIKNLKNDFGRPYSLKEFFEIYFGQNLGQAKDIFMKSLAAYSLVMYFLQAKDRHNGNIMLHRSGKIFHIDFGFFLSNMPGKGVQLQKDCPFKLLTQYIEVLDGPDSYYFKKFREYLFLGFKAVKKHQNKILMLIKMMYSSNGTTMPCFEKGQQAIRKLQQRFNPPKVHNDAELNIHCQKLINNSLDNWATKWYDRFQYFAQGIFY